MVKLLIFHTCFSRLFSLEALRVNSTCKFHQVYFSENMFLRKYLSFLKCSTIEYWIYRRAFSEIFLGPCSIRFRLALHEMKKKWMASLLGEKDTCFLEMKEKIARGWITIMEKKKKENTETSWKEQLEN